MVTYILMALAVAAVALLAGFAGGLPSPPQRPIENNGTTPEPELESQAADADDVANMRLPKASRPDRIITAMACALVVLVGAFGVVTFRLTACGGDQPKLQGTVGGSLADGTMIRPLRSAQAMQAANTSLHEEDHAPSTALVAMVAISEPPSHAAHEFRAMRKSAVGARKMAAVAKGLVTYSDHGTWLFPPDANGGG
jgi:hypothetical protein